MAATEETSTTNSERVITIMHVEDEAASWRFIPKRVWQLIRDEMSEDTRQTLVLTYPANRTTYPNATRIAWGTAGQRTTVIYWFVTAETLDEVAAECTGSLAIIVDVMRPDTDGLLKSSLHRTIQSLPKWIDKPTELVRLFTAFGIPDDELAAFGEYTVIRKSRLDDLLEFCLSKIRPIG